MLLLHKTPIWTIIFFLEGKKMKTKKKLYPLKFTCLYKIQQNKQSRLSLRWHRWSL